MGVVFDLTEKRTLQGEQMKKIFVLAVTMLLAASLSFGQATGGSTDSSTGKKATGKTKTKTKTKAHKGGKKGKKSSGGTTTPAPK
jgi:hypothetical protein